MAAANVVATVRVRGMWRIALAAFLGKVAARRGVKVTVVMEHR